MSFFRRKSKTKSTAYEADNNGSAHRSKSQDRNSKGPVSKSSIVVNVPQQGGDLCVVQHSYVAKEPGHISLLIGRIVQVTERRDDGLWKGTVQGEEGWFPASCVRLIDGVIAQAPARAPDVVTSTHRQSSPNLDLPDLQQVAASDDDDHLKSDEDRYHSHDDTMDYSGEVFDNANGKHNGNSGHSDSRMTSTPLSGSSARANEKLYIAMYPFEPSRPDQMALDRNELVYGLEESDPPGWIKARKKYTSEEGWVPKTYIRECASPVKGHERVLSSPDDPDSDHEFDSNFDDRFVATFSYEPQHEGDLGFSEGEVVAVVEMLDNGWWKGRIGDDRTGWFPGSYVQPMSPTEKGGLDAYMPAAGDNSLSPAANAHSFIYQNVGPNANKGLSLDAQMPVEASSPGPAQSKAPSIYQNIFPPNASAGDGVNGSRVDGGASSPATSRKPTTSDTPTNRPIADRQAVVATNRPDYLPPAPPVISILPPAGAVSQRPPAMRRGLLVSNPADLKGGHGRKDDKSKKSDEASDSESGKHAPEADKKVRRLSLPKLFGGKKKDKAEEKRIKDSRKGSIAGAESMTSLHSNDGRHDESDVAKSDILNISAPIIAAGVVPRYASVRHGSESRSSLAQATPEKPTALKAEVPIVPVVTVPKVGDAGGSPKKALQKTVSADVPFNGRNSFAFARQSSVGVSSFMPDPDLPEEQKADIPVTQPVEKRATLQRSQSLERRGSEVMANDAIASTAPGDNQLDVESVDYLATMGRRPKKPKLPPPKPPQRMNSMLSSKNLAVDQAGEASNAPPMVAKLEPQVDNSKSHDVNSTVSVAAKTRGNAEFSLPAIDHSIADVQQKINDGIDHIANDNAMEVTEPLIPADTDLTQVVPDLNTAVTAESTDIADPAVEDSAIDEELSSGMPGFGFSFRDELRMQAQRISVQRQQSNVDIDTQLDLDTKQRQHMSHSAAVVKESFEPNDLPEPLPDSLEERNTGSFSVDDVPFIDDAALVHDQVQEIFSICTLDDEQGLADIPPSSSAFADENTAIMSVEEHRTIEDIDGGKASVIISPPHAEHEEDHFEDAVEAYTPSMTNGIAVESTSSNLMAAVEEELTTTEAKVVEPVPSEPSAAMHTQIDDSVNVTQPKVNWVKEQRQKLNSQSAIDETTAVDMKKSKKGHKGEKKEKKKKEAAAVAPSVDQINAVTATKVTQEDRLSAAVSCDANELQSENLYVNVNSTASSDQNGVSEALHAKANDHMLPEQSKMAVTSAATDIEVNALASSPNSRRKKRVGIVEVPKEEVRVDALASSPTSRRKKVEAAENIKGDVSAHTFSPGSSHKHKVEVAEPSAEEISTLASSPTARRKKTEPVEDVREEVNALASSPTARRKKKVDVDETKEQVNVVVSSPKVRRKKKSEKTGDETGEKKTRKKKKTKNLLSCSTESVFSTDSLDIDAVPVADEPTVEPPSETIAEPVSHEPTVEPVSEPAYTTHTDISTDDIDVKDIPESEVVKKKKKKKKRKVEGEQAAIEQPTLTDVVTTVEPEIPVESTVIVPVDVLVDTPAGESESVVAMEGSPSASRKKVRKTKKGTGTKKKSKKSKGQLYASSESIDSIDDYLTAESDAEILDSTVQSKLVEESNASKGKEPELLSSETVSAVNAAVDLENRTHEPEVTVAVAASNVVPSLPSTEVRSASVSDSRSVQIDDLSAEPYSRASKRGNRLPEISTTPDSSLATSESVKIELTTPSAQQLPSSLPSNSVHKDDERISAFVPVSKFSGFSPTAIKTSISAHIAEKNSESVGDQKVIDSVTAADKTSISVPAVEKALRSDAEKVSNLAEQAVSSAPAHNTTIKTEAISPPKAQSGSVMKAARMFEEASGFTSTRKLSSASTDETFTDVTEAVDHVSATVVVDKPAPIVVSGKSSEERTSVTSPTRSTFTTDNDIASTTVTVSPKTSNIASPVSPINLAASVDASMPTSTEPVPVVAAVSSSSRKPSSRSSRTSDVLVVVDLPSTHATTPSAPTAVPSVTSSSTITTDVNKSIPLVDTAPVSTSSRKPSSRSSRTSDVIVDLPLTPATTPSASVTVTSSSSNVSSSLDKPVLVIETASVSKPAGRMSTGSEVLDALTAAVAPLSNVTSANVVSSSSDTKRMLSATLVNSSPDTKRPTASSGTVLSTVKTSPTVRFKLPHTQVQSGHDTSAKLPHYVHDKVKRFEVDGGSAATPHMEPGKDDSNKDVVTSPRTGAVHVLDTVRRFQGDSAAPTRVPFVINKHSEPTRKVEDSKPWDAPIKSEQDVTSVSTSVTSISPKVLPRSEVHATQPGSQKPKPVMLPKPVGWKPPSEAVTDMPVIATRKSVSDSAPPAATATVQPEGSARGTAQIDSMSLGARAFWPERQTKLIGGYSTQKKGLPPPAPKAHKQTVAMPVVATAKDLTSESDDIGSEEDTRKVQMKASPKAPALPATSPPNPPKSGLLPATEGQAHLKREHLETDLDAVITHKSEHEPPAVMSTSLVKLLAPKGFKSRFAGSTSSADQPTTSAGSAAVDKTSHPVAGLSDNEDLPPPPKLYTSSLTVMTGGKTNPTDRVYRGVDSKQLFAPKPVPANTSLSNDQQQTPVASSAALDDDYYAPPPRPLVPAHLAQEYSKVLASVPDSRHSSPSSNNSSPSSAQVKVSTSLVSPKVSPIGSINSSQTKSGSTSSPAAATAPANMRRISYWTEETDSDDQTSDDDAGIKAKGPQGGKVTKAEPEDEDAEEEEETMVPHGGRGSSASDDDDLPPPLPLASPPPLVPCLNDYYRIASQQRRIRNEDDEDVFDGRVADLGEHPGATDF